MRQQGIRMIRKCLKNHGQLMKVSESNKGYFYLEFVEGQKFEFWAMAMIFSNT